MSAQERLAQYALGLDFEALPPAIVDWAKGVLLDSLGCALTGYFSEPAAIGRTVFGQLGGVPESTVVGSGMRLPCTSAAWLNGTMVRYEDLNDTYNRPGRVGHYSELIPTALAVGERAGSSGAEVLAAIVAGYEVLGATTFHGPRIGVGFATFGAIGSPVVAGKLLGLTEAQIVNAIGISLSSNVTLISWLGKAAGSMLKATTWSTNAHHGILAALLAEEGFTGPATAIETYLDQFEVSHPDTTLPAPGEFTVLEHNVIKGYAAQMYTNPAIEAVLTLAREHGIGAEAVDEIVVHGTSELVRLAGGPATKTPGSREAADHSAPYVVAVALVEGDVLPAQYRRRQWEDPRVVTLMQKVTCVADEEYDRRFEADGSLPTRVEIRAGGATYATEVDGGGPRTPAAIEQKFRRVVNAYLGESQQDRIVELVAGLDRTPSLAPLMASLVF